MNVFVFIPSLGNGAASNCPKQMPMSVSGSGRGRGMIFVSCGQFMFRILGTREIQTGCCCGPAAVSLLLVSAAAFAMTGLLERLKGLCSHSLLTFSFLPRVGGVGRDWAGNKGWKGGREIT